MSGDGRLVTAAEPFSCNTRQRAMNVRQEHPVHIHATGLRPDLGLHVFACGRRSRLADPGLGRLLPGGHAKPDRPMIYGGAVEIFDWGVRINPADLASSAPELAGVLVAVTYRETTGVAKVFTFGQISLAVEQNGAPFGTITGEDVPGLPRAAVLLRVLAVKGPWNVQPYPVPLSDGIDGLLAHIQMA